MRDLVQPLFEFRMTIHILPDLIQGEAGLGKHSIEFLLALFFGFAQGHLYTAMGVDLAFTRGFDR